MIGPSMTQGASMRSERSAARKVRVRQWPCGTLATSRLPRAQRPWVRVILVLAQVSSMKTRRGIKPTLMLPSTALRRRATSGAILLAGVQAFF